MDIWWDVNRIYDWSLTEKQPGYKATKSIDKMESKIDVKCTYKGKRGLKLLRPKRRRRHSTENYGVVVHEIHVDRKLCEL